MKKHLIILLSFIAANTLAAQDSIVARSPVLSYVRQSEAWLASRNAAGLLLVPVQKISTAEVFGSRGKGGFVDYYRSADSYEWGADTESYFRLSDRVTLYGKVRYTNFTGQDMGGSAFIDPGYNAFDLSETADSTRGEKNMETFVLSGSLAAQLGHGFALGGSVHYRTANYAKYRDLRHTNKLLDLTASGGFTYRTPADGSFPSLTAGACYIYRRSVEGITFNMYGTTGKQYYTLVNFGGFYGNNELWSTSGSKSYTIDSKPVFNEFHGGSVQLGLQLQNGWSAFGEATLLKRSGYYGKKSPNTYVFTDHAGTETEALATLAYRHLNALHSLSVRAGKEHLENFELVSHEEHTQGNRSSIVYTGKNLMLERDAITVDAEYTGSLDVRNFCPAWQFRAGGSYRSLNRRVSLYPYYRLQNIREYSACASAERNIFHGKNQYGLVLGLLYGAGNGTAKDDRTYVPPSSTQMPPKSQDNLLYREYEYLTAPRIRANAGISYSRLLNPAVRGYIRADGELTIARKIEYLDGRRHVSATLAIGCIF
ncbi:MAG: hypothetical protein LBK22_05465 [Tannerella sp.]|nr:hypothetical protein [Tannerella sp.]